MRREVSESPGRKTCIGQDLKKERLTRQELGGGRAAFFAGAIVELTYKWIALAGRQYQLYLNRRLAPCGLSGSQYLLVLNVCRQPGITQDKLPDILHINKSNVTRALAQLERSGFIRREVNMRDKRTAALFPTPKAREVYPRIREIITGWDAAVTESLTEDEKRILQELLMRVVAAARQRPEGDGGEQDGTGA